MASLPFWRADVPLPFNDLDELKEQLQHPLRVLYSRGRAPSAVEIEGGLVVKYSEKVFFSELCAMRLVLTLDTVPIPRPFFYSQETSSSELHCGYLVMEKVPGVPLSSVLDDLSATACQVVIDDLKRYLDALHKLDNGSWGMVGKGGFFHGHVFQYIPGAFAPGSMLDFIQYFIAASKGIYEYQKMADEAARCMAGIDLDRPPEFSHADLVPVNIMVDASTGRITSIIDWEFAGWYPYFWNHFIARRKNFQLHNKNWAHIYAESMNGSEHLWAGDCFSLFEFNADVHGSQDFTTRCSCCTRT